MAIGLGLDRLRELLAERDVVLGGLGHLGISELGSSVLDQLLGLARPGVLGGVGQQQDALGELA